MVTWREPSHDSFRYLSRSPQNTTKIVMEVLSNSSTIAEICRKYNVASSAVYRLRYEFISA